jgi:hypothetical protein
MDKYRRAERTLGWRHWCVAMLNLLRMRALLAAVRLSSALPGSSSSERTPPSIAAQLVQRFLRANACSTEHYDDDDVDPMYDSYVTQTEDQKAIDDDVDTDVCSDDVDDCRRPSEWSRSASSSASPASTSGDDEDLMLPEAQLREAARSGLAWARAGSIDWCVVCFELYCL